MQDDLRALMQRPVILTNDANCLALSEATDGAGKDYGVVFAAAMAAMAAMKHSSRVPGCQ